MEDFIDCEVWLQVTDGGDYEVGTSQESLAERFDDNIGISGGTVARIFKITVKVPLPKVQECEIVAPAEKETKLTASFQYKGDWYSCKVVPVDRFFPSSKKCSVCGEIKNDLTLADREWTCPCGVHHDRDHNASVNLENVAASLPET